MTASWLSNDSGTSSAATEDDSVRFLGLEGTW
jgi:hypothetical protein